MKRRTAPEEDEAAGGTPPHLLCFEPVEWGGDTLEAAGRWWAAREAWQAETGTAADLDWSHAIPDAPFDLSQI
jgi:hypothetical protein